MTVTLMQTADAIFYYPMLIETAKTVRAFCARNGFAYEQYVGIKRGSVPWQASYNRVYMLKEMLDRGGEGWVLYLDADAFIQDLDFDFRDYLSHHADKAAIFSGYSSCETAYDINSGGFAINLSHPVAKSIILDWHRSVASIPDEIFDRAVDWQFDLANDQHLLWGVLHRYVEELGLAGTLVFERANQSYVNNGPFIAQLLRSMYPTYRERLAAIKARVQTLTASEPDLYGDNGPGLYLPARHPNLVTACGMKELSAIISRGAEGGLMFGPYVRLPAGRYIARIFGEAKPTDGQPDGVFVGDVTVDKGRRILAAQTIAVSTSTPLRGVLVELDFETSEDFHDVEVRLVMNEHARITAHAIQISPSDA